MLNTPTTPAGVQLPPPITDAATARHDGRTPPTVRSRLRPLMNVGAMVAVLGLLFTMSTYWVDQRSQTREDERQARAALTEITGQITALVRLYAPDLAELTGPALVDAYSSLNTETVVQVAQAEQLASENPSIVRATDRYAIGDANLRLGNYDRAYASYAEADRLSSSGSDYGLAFASRRGMAASLFALDRADEARALLESVVAGDGFEDLAQTVSAANAQNTLVYWTRYEAGLGNCPEARDLILRLEDLALKRGTALDVQLLAELSESVRLTCG